MPPSHTEYVQFGPRYVPPNSRETEILDMIWNDELYESCRKDVESNGNFTYGLGSSKSGNKLSRTFKLHLV